ncbi:response regulator, partial [Leptolyngbya sp. FACHB-36]|uniref:response regulator n=1 Tax=Leptolyngbya sp. FACHB-36 TaxID=2692808 RepID=UPI0016809E7C
VDRRVAVLEQAVALLLQDQLTEALRQQAEQESHKLAGSLGMFGSDEGSRLAQKIEPLFETGRSLNFQQKQHLAQLVTALRQELQRMDDRHLPDIISSEPEDERPWFVIISSNRALTDQLAEAAPRWGLRPGSIANPVAARAQICQKRPDVVLLDMTSANTLENYWMLLSELSANTPPVPTLVLIEQNSLIDRVEVARLGGRGVLQQPVTATQVLEAVNQALQNSQPTQAMVMVVDDDRQVLTALQRLLIPWGLHVTVLDNPLRFLDTLESTRPDLLVLDVEMPEINGIELCQVVRNDLRWSSLPVLFLTAHSDAETMHRVFEAGADDYVRKPIVGPELVTRIFNRLERSRLLKCLAETDALTGVPNRQKSTQSLTQFLQWCSHCQRSFCFALIQLDHLKQVNQQYSHAMGDDVLARFGELLRQVFHSEDVVGRWGGAEFVVGMPTLTKKDAAQRLSELRKTLNRLEFTAEDGTPFRATFRAGVVQYPQDGADLQTLYQAANLLLSQDRTGGGNP